MRPLAHFIHASGAVVTGSDAAKLTQPMPFDIANDGSESELKAIDKAQTIVFSSAISRDHPAWVYAASKGKSILHRSEMLSELTRFYKTISIAGTHGKSTVSALVTHILLRCGKRPSWIIGAPFANGVDAFGVGTSDTLVVEADESDGTFLRYKTQIGLINNIAPDHLDFYGDLASLREAFSTFARSITADGACVYGADCEHSRKAVLEAKCTKRGFGASSDANGQLCDWAPNGLQTTISAAIDGQALNFSLPLTGRHNALNALAAILITQQAGVSPEQGARTLADFPGVARRLQRYPSTNEALIFDDYAHNPGKIFGCLQGLRSAFPSRRLIAVFQPHRYSRVSSLYDDFVRSFKCENTLVIVLPIYAAGEHLRPDLSPDKLAVDISIESQVKTFSALSLKEATNLVNSMMVPQQDVIVTLGAGDVWQVAKALSQSP